VHHADVRISDVAMLCVKPVPTDNGIRLKVRFSQPGQPVGPAKYKQKVAALKGTATLVLGNFVTVYLFRKRLAMPSEPSAAPSNITVVPPSGTPPVGLSSVQPVIL